MCEDVTCLHVKGKLFVDGYEEKELYTFLDYISSGFELNFMVAVDFTGKCALISYAKMKIATSPQLRMVILKTRIHYIVRNILDCINCDYAGH
ncbi:putative protein BONZAI [Helianthus anomalus]